MSDFERIARENAGLFRPGFPDWVKDNEHVVNEFSRVATLLRNRGQSYYAGAAILYHIRVMTDLQEVGYTPFKINQNHARDLAVLHLLRFPDFAGFFRFKKCDREAML